MDGDREKEIHQLLEDGSRLTGLSLEDLGYLPDPEDLAEEERDAMDLEDLEWLLSITSTQRADSLHQARLLAGVLWRSSVILVERLFEDIAAVRHQEIVTSGSVEDTWILSELPREYATQYTAQFAQRFLVVTVDMTAALARGWDGPTCVAQELSLRCLINQVEETAALHELELAPDWRSRLEDLLLEDTDIDTLYQSAMEGFEHNHQTASRLGPARMRTDYWFEPFNLTRHIPPYARQ